MNAANKKKIAEIFTGILKKRIKRKCSPTSRMGSSLLYNLDEVFTEASDFLNSMGLEVIERKRRKKEWWENRRLIPAPRDNKKSVCVKVWSPSPSEPQIWVRLDRDVALKILILGTFPETIQPEA